MRKDKYVISKLSIFVARKTWRFYRRYPSFCEKHFDDNIGNIQQYLFIFFLWSEMKDFARLSEIGLSNI